MSDASSSQQGHYEDGSDCDGSSVASAPLQETPYEALRSALGRTHIPIVRLGSKDAPVDEENPLAERAVTELTLLRDYVSKSVPCIIRGLLEHWDAVQKWRDDAYLFQTAPNQFAAAAPPVTVALTPNGRADCITDVLFIPPALRPGGEAVEEEAEGESETLFMAPAEVKVTLPHLKAMIDDAKLRSLLMAPLSVDLCASGATRRFRPTAPQDVDPLVPIPYCQLQNNCLETEYTHLKHDISDNVKHLGERLFGTPCDASNVWIGTNLSVTSMHQDWYENLYAVVRGCKTFTLIPPWEAPLVKKEKVRSAKYVVETAHKGEENNVPKFNFQKTVEFEADPMEWIGVDLEDTPDYDILARNPDILSATISQAQVHAGEVLYLPAMWLHRVAQHEEPDDDTCIVAVNYWYDMAMDGPLYHLVQYAAKKEGGAGCASC